MTVLGMCGVMRVRIIFSRVLAMGERREMGLYDVLHEVSFWDLATGMMLAVFHVWGMILLLSMLL